MTTAFVGFIGVIVGSVLTAFLNFYLQRAADRRRWQREDDVQRQRWEREERIRYHQDRLTAYRNLYNAVNPAKLGFIQDERFDVIGVDAAALTKGVEEISAYHSEIQFVNASEAVLRESGKVNREVQILRLRVRNHLTHKGALNDRLAKELLDPPLNANAEFRVAARKELGIEDSLTKVDRGESPAQS